MNEQELIEVFKERGALLEGHFRLTSGLHSNGYIQCAQVLKYPDLSTELGKNSK
jgi:orotate phosphoribosyltransferase